MKKKAEHRKLNKFLGVFDCWEKCERKENINFLC